MKKPCVLDLADANDAELVGGKAYALGKMLRAGFEVPSGFVVTTWVFQAMTAELEAEIMRHFEMLQADFVAVRSSAVAEDSADAAWAGQLDTFLNTDQANLLKNIETCWSSAGSVRAKAYAAQKSLRIGPVAVLVQKMVQGEVSGVAFSVHPVSGNRQQLVIEAGFGLGEAIVAGQITPDTYITHKSAHQPIEKYISQQTKKLAQDTSSKTSWQNLGEPGNTQKLSDEQIIELSGVVQKLERYFGYPVDVEWALRDDIFYTLQCRPITTLAN